MPDVVNIREQPHLLNEVKDLWRKNSRKLGPFPDGAFEEYARKGWIRIAVQKGRCIGYLLFREVITRNEVAIVHLCVSEEARGHGVALDLVQALKEETRAAKGIGLWCRRDYAVSALWPRLDFVAWKERRGRGRDGGVLLYWWYDHGHIDLFDQAATEDSHQRLVVAMDANVFYDLEGTNSDEDSESYGLAADWLQPQIVLRVTPELLNEIRHNEDPAGRDRQRVAAQRYRVLKTRPLDFQKVLGQLNKLLGPAEKPQDEADRRHLVHAALAEVDYFVTRDGRLLNKSTNIYDLLGLALVRPSELISRIDALLRERDYQPKRLMGSHIFRLEQNLGEHESLAKEFLSNFRGERIVELAAKLRRLASAPRDASLQTITEAGGKTIGLLGCAKNGGGEWQVELCRVAKGSMARTLASQLLDTAVREAIDQEALVCRYCDSYASQEVIEALTDTGFKRKGEAWIKINLTKVTSLHNIIGCLADFDAPASDVKELARRFSEALKQAQAHDETVGLLAVERALRPLKITDLDLPTYVVPIEAVWAIALFDDDLASDELFSEKPELMFKRSNAYYRAARPGHLRAPGRLLWYVKNDKRRKGTKAVRAVSYLDEVVVDTPISLFKRFQRLGVYAWQDIASIAGSGPDSRTMALRFSDTERFVHSIPFDEVQAVLQAHAQKKNQFQSPVRISTPCFVDLYTRGML